jgi:integrase
VLGLEVDHVDFLHRELRVVQQCNSLSSGAVFISAPKTRTSVRTVELPSVVADALASHLAENRASAVDVLDRTDPRNERTRAAELIFRNSAGRPQHRGSWARFWSQAARSVGLPAGAGFHTLRHYYATLLIESGASVKTVQLALGHASPSTTLDVYAGVWPDQLDRTRNLVDAALSRGQEVAAW